MNENFNEKIKIKNIACELLRNITDEYFFPYYLTQHQKDDLEYHEEFLQKFKNTLTEKQKKDLDSLNSINNCLISTDIDFAIIYGILLKTAFDKIIESPLEILELRDSMGTKARDLYKPAEQKN